MQHWKAKHSQRVIAGGAFKGARFGELSHDQLIKASKRYPADLKLQKYAKAVVSSAELDEVDPTPCLPVALSIPTEQKSLSHGLVAVAKRFLSSVTYRRTFVIFCICTALMFLIRPSLATAFAKMLVRLMRLGMRHVTGFLLMIVEGLLDELVYQIEFSLRQALPHNLDWEQVTQEPLSLFSHLLSALVGASVSMLTTYMHGRLHGRIPHIPAVD